ncbi:hypothetical protein JY97_00515 [Alkalispirochaeta odontotermitis]|nr:hypothetical protein JY97_00515 [Alkalispirochaeta odontotermitis]
MKLVTWESNNAADGFQWLAKWQVKKIVRNKKPDFDETHERNGFLPIYFHGQTEQAAIEAANEWWATDEENRTAKLKARKEAAAKRKKERE